MYESSKKNERQLISLLANDDVKAFDQLFYLYSDRLFRFAFSLLKNTEDSKEIVQDAFFRIWNKRKDIDSSKSFKSFLFTISYRLIIDQLRIRLKDKEYRNFVEDYFRNNTADMHHLADFNILNRQISEIVESLPERRKMIYQLSREKGLTHKEISSELGVSVKTVENQINLALKTVKKHLGEELLPVLLFYSLFM